MSETPATQAVEITRVAANNRRVFARDQTPKGLTATQVQGLVAFRSVGPTTSHALADALALHRSRVAVALGELDDLKLISLTADPARQRRTRAALRASGRRAATAFVTSATPRLR